MFVMRPIRASDTDAFVTLAFEAGLGLISIPKNPTLLAELIHRSEKSFAKNVDKPVNETYLFALENIQDNTLGGVCGIHSKTGVTSPSTFFRKDKLSQHNTHLGLQSEIPFLKLVHYVNGPSEICSLYLGHNFRHSGLGRLLSLSRLLFIASRPERFDTMLFADMRGVVEGNTHCPFWNGIGRHFLNMDYASLMQEKNTKDFSVVEMLPDSPIFLPLLPLEVQQSIGKVHQNTAPALNMLMQEGFCISEDVSIYDGGPKIVAETKEVSTIKHSAVKKVATVLATQQDDASYLISNEHLNFRCCFGKITFNNNDEIIISTNVAGALQVDAGDKVRIIQHHARTQP